MSSTSRTMLAVLNISWTCARHDLKTYFKKYGKVQRIRIPMDQFTGFNKKVAYVEIEGKEDISDKILQDCHIIDNQEVTVKLDIPFSERRTRDQSSASV